MADEIRTLGDACLQVMNDPEVRVKYEDGLLTSGNILDEIRIKHPDGFPYCTWIDVHDEMDRLYGKPTRPGRI